MALLQTTYSDGDILYAGAVTSISSVNGITTTVNSNTIAVLGTGPFTAIPYPSVVAHWSALDVTNGWVLSGAVTYTYGMTTITSTNGDKRGVHIPTGRITFSENQYFRSTFVIANMTDDNSWFRAGLGDGDETSLNHAAFFIWIKETGTLNLYAHTSGGAGVTNTQISGITYTDKNLYEIIFTAGSSAVFKVNGVVEATVTTNLPSTTASRNDLEYYYHALTGASDVAHIAETWLSSEF